MQVERIMRHRKSRLHEVVVITGSIKCITEEGEWKVGDQVFFESGIKIIAGLKSAGTLTKPMSGAPAIAKKEEPVKEETKPVKSKQYKTFSSKKD